MDNVDNMNKPLEETRAHRDSGVVSPQNNRPSSQQLQCKAQQSFCKLQQIENKKNEGGILAESKGAGGEIEDTTLVRNDEERFEVDCGLGSSVCGEDLALGSNIADAVMINQREISKFVKLNLQL